jgi:hypothetical protein
MVMDSYAGVGSDRSRKRGRDESEEESASGSESESGSEVNHQSVEEMEAEVEEMRAEYNLMRAQVGRLHAEAAARDFEADQEDGMDVGSFRGAINSNDFQILIHQAQIRDLRRDTQKLQKRERLSLRRIQVRALNAVQRSYGEPEILVPTEVSEDEEEDEEGEEEDEEDEEDDGEGGEEEDETEDEDEDQNGGFYYH